MNNKQQTHKITRKNKKSQRQFKQLNSDYYIKVMNPDKKTVDTLKKCTNTKRNYQSSSNRKLYSTSSSSSQLVRNSRCYSKTKSKNSQQLVGIQRTRSSTTLNKRKNVVSQPQNQNTQLQLIYSKIQKVLEAYQTKIHNLQERNKCLSQQNVRLRARSCNYF